MQAKIEVNKQELEHWLGFLNVSKQRSVIMNVTNKLARRARKMVKDRVVQTYNIRPGSVLIKIFRARPHNLVARLSARKKPYSLSRFKPVQTASGVSVQVRRGSSETIPGAFMARPSGRDWRSRGQRSQGVFSRFKLVFKRVGKKAYKLSAPRSTFSLGEFLQSHEAEAMIGNMIAAEGPAMIQQGVKAALYKGAGSAVSGAIKDMVAEALEE